MSYTDVFGGQNIFPAQLTLLQLDPQTADVTLSWPVEQALPGDSVFADIIETTPGAGLAIIMPDARMAGPGQSTLINNLGANTITVKDAAGGAIGSVASGEVWQFYLHDNSTQAGTWKTFQFGAGASSAVAAALAGAGLKAILTTLNVKVAPTVTNVTPTTIADADRAKAIIWNGGVGDFNLPDPATVGSDWFVYVRNSGTGTLTVTPAAGSIDGDTSKDFHTTESAMIVTDGVDYFTIGYGQSISSSFDYTTINVAGTGDYTLSGGQLNRITYKLTGVLTGARNIIVPSVIQQYWIDNSTSGAFDLEVKTVAGTGVVVPQGSSMILYCDGNNVVAANGDPLTGVAPLALGGLGVALVDPNADRILFWDDSTGQFAFLIPGTGLQIVGTTLSVALDPAGRIAAGGSVSVNNNTLTSVAAMSGIALETGSYEFEGVLSFSCANAATALAARFQVVGNTATLLTTDDLLLASYNYTNGVIVTGDVNAPNAGVMGVEGSEGFISGGGAATVTLPLGGAAGSPVVVSYKGALTVSVAGTVDFKISQLITDAGNPVVLRPGSFIRYKKVA